MRPMTEGDLPAMSRWVNTAARRPVVGRAPVARAGGCPLRPGVRGEDAVRYWIWEVNGRSVGFSQDYRIADHPEYALLCGRPDAIGYDYVIGEPAFVDRGLGTKLLWVFLRDIVVPAYDPVERAVRRAGPPQRPLAARAGEARRDPGAVVRRAAVGRQGGHRRGVQHRRPAGTEVGMTIHVGISGWRYPPWRGDFYPKGLPQRRELEYAASQLTSIEINGSFYSLQRPSSYAKWRAEVPDDFVFAVKGGRFITHMKRLRDVEAPLANFFASGVLALDRRSGPILWQLPATFPYDGRCCADFFALLPAHDDRGGSARHPARRQGLRRQAVVRRGRGATAALRAGAATPQLRL